MRSLDISSENGVKQDLPGPVGYLALNAGIAVFVELVDWPGGRLAVIAHDRDGEFRIALNARHECVQNWLTAANRRTKARALAGLLKLLARHLRAIGGVNPFEHVAIKKSIELYA